MSIQIQLQKSLAPNNDLFKAIKIADKFTTMEVTVYSHRKSQHVDHTAEFDIPISETIRINLEKFNTSNG